MSAERERTGEAGVYLCHNPACVLGRAGEPGRFTGGISAELRHYLTGEPEETLVEGRDYGEGICPNCGERGEPA